MVSGQYGKRLGMGMEDGVRVYAGSLEEMSLMKNGP